MWYFISYAFLSYTNRRKTSILDLSANMLALRYELHVPYNIADSTDHHYVLHMVRHFGNGPQLCTGINN